MRAAVVGGGDCSKPLLASCIPLIAEQQLVQGMDRAKGALMSGIARLQTSVRKGIGRAYDL